jgi:DNA-binding NarL/FixJ family response regulator
MKDISPRTQQVVDLLLQGYRPIDISSSLGIASRTVKAHLNKMYLRFGIEGRIKHVRLAILILGKDNTIFKDLDLFTPRENKIAKLIAQGAKNKEIANQLGVGSHGVKNTVGIIFDKAGMHNRIEFVIWYISQQGVTDEIRSSSNPALDSHIWSGWHIDNRL